MTMSTLKPTLFMLAVLVFSSAASAAPPMVFNITRLLGKYVEFEAFNAFLTQTNVSFEINSRRTITVLAFDNDAAAALKGKPIDVVRDVLRDHVILDYFGPEKLRRRVLRDRSALVTTLLQASGVAADMQGFLKVSVAGDGDGIAFGSGVKGSPLVAKLVGQVVSRPYDISVLQVSAAIFAPGVDPNPSPPLPPAAPEAPPPEDAPAPETGDEDDIAPDVAAEAPEADAPEGSDDAPASSPSEYSEDEKYDDSDAGSPPVGKRSGSSRAEIGSVLMIIGLLSFFG